MTIRKLELSTTEVYASKEITISENMLTAKKRLKILRFTETGFIAKVIDMEPGRCSFGCAIVHLFINVVLLILGMCLLGFGMAEETANFSALISAETRIGTIAIVIGVSLIVVTTLDCCFTIDGSSIFYYIYAGFLASLCTAIVVLLIKYGADYGTKAQSDIRASMREMMHYDPDGTEKTGMDFIQQMFQCCGIDSYTDWYNVTEKPYIPESCCIKPGCDTLFLENIHQQDCVTNTMKFVDSLFGRITAIEITIAIFLPIQIVVVISIIRCIRYDAIL